jgi:hypothetical protein
MNRITETPNEIINLVVKKRPMKHYVEQLQKKQKFIEIIDLTYDEDDDETSTSTIPDPYLEARNLLATTKIPDLRAAFYEVEWMVEKFGRALDIPDWKVYYDIEVKKNISDLRKRCSKILKTNQKLFDNYQPEEVEDEEEDNRSFTQRDRDAEPYSEIDE